MAKVKNFKTVFPAVSVPLNDDYTINEPEFRAYLRWMKTFYNQGIQGLVCNGHTGEITGLSRAERKRVVEICSEECGDIMTIISGINCENTIESIEMAKEAKEAGADFVKTSTGFSTAGATQHHVELMRDTVGKDMKIKASGGIRTLSDAQLLIKAGADRLGCSASVSIIEEYEQKREAR